MSVILLKCFVLTGFLKCDQYRFSPVIVLSTEGKAN